MMCSVGSNIDTKTRLLLTFRISSYSRHIPQRTGKKHDRCAAFSGTTVPKSDPKKIAENTLKTLLFSTKFNFSTSYPSLCGLGTQILRYGCWKILNSKPVPQPKPERVCVELRRCSKPSHRTGEVQQRTRNTAHCLKNKKAHEYRMPTHNHCCFFVLKHVELRKHPNVPYYTDFYPQSMPRSTCIIV